MSETSSNAGGASSTTCNTREALLERIVGRLEVESEEGQQEAAQDLIGVAVSGGPAGVHAVRIAVSPLLNHLNIQVRVLAFRVLGSLACDGDAVSLQLVLQGFSDFYPEVQRAAAGVLCGLKKLAETEGSESAAKRSRYSGVSLLSAATMELQHRDWRVRSAALCAVGQLAGGCRISAATAAAVGCFADDKAEVRDAAIKLVGRFASEPQGGTALAALVEASGSDRPEMRKGAAPLLKETVSKGDATAFVPVAVLLKHGSSDIRYAAAYTLGQLAERNLRAGKPREDAKAAILEALTDKHPNVRYGVVEALMKLAAPDDHEAKAAFAGKLADEDPRVCAKAYLALTFSRVKCSRAVLGALSLHVRDNRSDVRSFAVRAIRILAEPGDPVAKQCLVVALKDRDTAVRRHVLMSLARIAPKGDPDVAAAVKACQKDSQDRKCWLLAVWVLWGMADGGYGSIFGTVLAMIIAALTAAVLCWARGQAEPEVPKTAEVSGLNTFSLLFWLARTIAGLTLVRLLGKGWGSLGGAAATLAAAVSAGAVLRT